MYIVQDVATVVLISSCIAVQFNNTWDDFLQMSYVADTLVSVNRFPECFNAVNQLFLCPRLYLSSLELFEFMPQIFYWIKVRRFCWGLPLVQIIGVSPRLSMARCVFWVIVLHETNSFWVYFCSKWHKGFVQDLGV